MITVSVYSRATAHICTFEEAGEIAATFRQPKTGKRIDLQPHSLKVIVTNISFVTLPMANA